MKDEESVTQRTVSFKYPCKIINCPCCSEVLKGSSSKVDGSLLKEDNRLHLRDPRGVIKESDSIYGPYVQSVFVRLHATIIDKVLFSKPSPWMTRRTYRRRSVESFRSNCFYTERFIYVECRIPTVTFYFSCLHCTFLRIDGLWKKSCGPGL